MDQAQRRAAIILGAIPAVVVAIVVAVVAVFLVPWWLALLLAVAAGAAAGWVTWQRSDRFVLGKVGARPLRDGEDPRLENLVERLCVAIGVHEPALAVLDVPAANALALRRGTDAGTIVLTRGLLDSLDRIQMEAVLAHLLTRLRGGWTGVDAMAATVAATVLAPVPPLARRVCGSVLPGHPEVLADLDGIALTRYPPGLERALLTMQEVGTTPPTGPHLAHLWLAPGDAALRPSPFTLDDRVAILRER